MFASSGQKIDMDEQVQRALNGISDVPITKEISDMVTATSVDENGNITILTPSITIHKEELNARTGESKYVLTAVATLNPNSRVTAHPEDTNSRLEGDVVATLEWTDVFGTKNILDEVQIF